MLAVTMTVVHRDLSTILPVGIAYLMSDGYVMDSLTTTTTRIEPSTFVGNSGKHRGHERVSAQAVSGVGRKVTHRRSVGSVTGSYRDSGLDEQAA